MNPSDPDYRIINFLFSLRVDFPHILSQPTTPSYVKVPADVHGREGSGNAAIVICGEGVDGMDAVAEYLIHLSIDLRSPMCREELEMRGCRPNHFRRPGEQQCGLQEKHEHNDDKDEQQDENNEPGYVSQKKFARRVKIARI